MTILADNIDYISDLNNDLADNLKNINLDESNLNVDVKQLSLEKQLGRLMYLTCGRYNLSCVSDDELNIDKIVEKSCISENPQKDHMVTGTFWFRKGRYFIEAAKELIDKDTRINGEYYVGTSINYLILQGLKVKLFEVEKWISFGDPTELNLYYFWQDHMMSLN